MHNQQNVRVSPAKTAALIALYLCLLPATTTAEAAPVPKMMIPENNIFLSEGSPDLVDILVRKIIESHTRTTSTSTATSTATNEALTFKEIPTIETSTTTLSIEAPLIKVWQSEGGIVSNLSQGSKNNQVLMLQGALRAFVPGYKGEYLSGYFGPKTASALKEFQKANSLPQTGTVGPKTKDILNKKYLTDFCPQRNGVNKLFENLDRTQAIAEDYVPPELVVLKPVRTAGIVCLSSEPAQRLTAMFNDAKKAGFNLIVLSGYRRFEIQKLLKSWSSDNKITDLNEAIGLAEAGHSEHQLGTAVDISGKSLKYAGPDSAFGKTPEGKWLQKNSYKYGFIMSYPKDKEKLTGYIYEPWHFRYVGVDNATDIFQDNITIQEYLNLQNSTTTNARS
jgi:D-alanyl-D-alanine carboxypeptidase